jgi:DNA-binding transcriptional regulator YiaG
MALGVAVTTVARWEQGTRDVTALAETSLTLLERLHGVAPTRPTSHRKAS